MPAAAVVPTQPQPSRAAVVALVGNPNTGKTTLFNALTGYRRHVANYPGVTVDLARGPVRGAAGLELLDLPGTYSLATVSPDERVVSELLGGGGKASRPDALIAIVDASNPQRNLYLLSQLLELGRPLVVALNMCDVAEARGLRIDAGELARRLGVSVVPIVATTGQGVPALVAATQAALSQPPPRPPPIGRSAAPPAGEEPGAAEVRARYAWVRDVLAGVVTRPDTPLVTASDRLDRVLTHKVAGGAVLALVLAIVFQAIYQWAAPLMDLIEGFFGWAGELVGAALPAGPLKSLIVDGVISGIGGVLVFLPQIMILFAFIALLEDCGYLARAAYMMDRLMRGLGLSGRAFIPLLSSFACAVPAIMGTRVIADRGERFRTIMLAPFMSCSARLPVYVLLIGAFVPRDTALGAWLPGGVMLAMYSIGVVVAVPIAWLLRLGAPNPAGGGFLLELPSYKWPRPRAIWHRVCDAASSFIVRAGTIILAVNLVVWALAYWPRDMQTEQRVRAEATAEGWDDARTEAEVAGAYLRASFLGRIGHAIEPALRPLGWDWRIGMAVAASFPAREVVVATLGTIFNLGGEAEEESLRAALHAAHWPDSGAPLFTLPVALSIMVFFALCAQCVSTLVIIGRETRSWRWPIASFVGMTGLAYAAAWLTTNLPRLF